MMIKADYFINDKYQKFGCLPHSEGAPKIIVAARDIKSGEFTGAWDNVEREEAFRLLCGPTYEIARFYWTHSK